ncbi:MAG: AraC family transcriptional regulator [Ignavibacteriaceae bacterium]
MQLLQAGEHFGRHKKTIMLGGIILHESVYDPEVRVPWHYHENAYFFYTVKGNLVEADKKESFICTPGTVLFHHRQEPHYNKDLSEDSVFFHAEVNNNWLNKFGLTSLITTGNSRLENPQTRSAFNRIYRELKICDSTTQIAVEGLLLQVFADMVRYKNELRSSVPGWVNKVREILHDNNDKKMTLSLLSKEAGIHPVHLSRGFSKYFNSTFGDYLRKIKLDKSVGLLADSTLTLTQIAHQCGFSDQSHFIRLFKSVNGITPNQYRKNLKS